MRHARLKGEREAEAAYHHCISRIVDRRFVLEAREKEIFVRMMRGYEAYCGVRIITFCVMSNHFHILLEVPRRPPKELLPSDAKLVERLREAQCSYSASTLEYRPGDRQFSAIAVKGFEERVGRFVSPVSKDSLKVTLNHTGAFDHLM